MSAPVFIKKPASYDDIVALPEHLVGELVDGELYVSPRPAAPHAKVASVLGMDLGGPFQRGRGGPGGWWILDEPELHFGRDVLVPDLAGWRTERLPRVPHAPYFTLAPDWVCEVLSRSTARLDRTLKLPRYGKADVSHAWVIDPALQTLEIFRLDRERWILAGAFTGEDKVRAEPFDAVELDLAALWTQEEEAAAAAAPEPPATK